LRRKKKFSVKLKLKKIAGKIDMAAASSSSSTMEVKRQIDQVKEATSLSLKSGGSLEVDLKSSRANARVHWHLLSAKSKLKCTITLSDGTKVLEESVGSKEPVEGEHDVGENAVIKMFVENQSRFGERAISYRVWISSPSGRVDVLDEETASGRKPMPAALVNQVHSMFPSFSKAFVAGALRNKEGDVERTIELMLCLSRAKEAEQQENDNGDDNRDE
jgi:CUE domain